MCWFVSSAILEQAGSGQANFLPMFASVLGTVDKLHDTSHEDRVPLNDDFEMSSEAGAGASVVEKGCAEDVIAHEVPNLTLWDAVQTINFW